MKAHLETLLAGELACPPGRRRIEFTDHLSPKAVPGLFLETREASPGRGTWFLRWKQDGKTRYKKIGCFPETTLPEARGKAKELKSQIANGLQSVTEVEATNRVPTFSEFFFSSYMPAAKVRKRSWQRDEQIYRLRLRALADIPLDQLTRQQIANLHIGLKNRGYAAATCNHALKVVRQTLNLAVSYEVIAKNPAVGIRGLPEHVVDRFLTPEELVRLLKVLKTDSNRNVCQIILWLLSTGVRYREGLGAKWSQIDMQNRIWRIPRESTKSQRPRVVPLNDVALRVLSELDTKDRYEHLFVNPRTEQPYRYIHKVWERIRSEAGINARLHDLRHTFGAALSNQGESLHVIGRLLGHAGQSQVTERYSGLRTATLIDASNKVAKVLEEAMQQAS